MKKIILVFCILFSVAAFAQPVRFEWKTNGSSGGGTVAPADSGRFTVWYQSDSVSIAWGKSDPVPVPPIDTIPVLPPNLPVDPETPLYPGKLYFDEKTRRFTAPDGNSYPDVRGAGVEWARIDTGSWVKFRLLAGATGGQILKAIEQADAALPGGVVLLPPGEYNISAPIQIIGATNVIIRGSGKGNTVLNFTGGSGAGAYVRIRDRENQARHFVRDIPAWQDTLRFTNSDWHNHHRARYIPGRYVYLSSQVPAEWEAQYHLWFSGAWDWAHGMARIIEANYAENWIRIADPFPVSMRNIRINPVEPSEFVGVEGVSIQCPTVPVSVLLHGIQILYSANIWLHRVDVRNPSNWPVDFNRSIHGEQKFSRCYKNQWTGEGGGRGYGGALGSRFILLDSVRYDAQRHALITGGGQAQSVFRNIAAYQADAHLPHHVWEFSNLYELMYHSKNGNGMPEQIMIGPGPSNGTHFGGMQGSAIYRSMFVDPFVPRFNGRCLTIGSATDFVISHCLFESTLFHSAAQNAMIGVWDLSRGTISDSRFIYRPENTWFQGREVLIDIWPGVVRQGNSIVQTGRTSYPGLQIGGAEVSPVASRAEINLRNIDVVNIDPSRWYRSYGGVMPKVENVRPSANDRIEVPAGIPGIPSMYEAQKAY